MANGQGFMIPLDQADWTNGGNRTGWCTGSHVWWTNTNITLTGTSQGPTDAAIGDHVTINVGVQGLIDPGGGGPSQLQAVVTGVQAWVCLPTTGPVGTAGTLIPSMAALLAANQPLPTWSGSTQLAPATPPAGYQSTAGSPPPFASFSLAPQWTPGIGDIVAPNLSTHCCVIANCYGFADLQGPAGDQSGPQAGNAIPSDLAGINVCNVVQQGQLNIAVVPAGGLHRDPGLGLFGFIAANPALREPVEVLVEVTPVGQVREAELAIMRSLERGPYRELKLKAATAQPRALLLRDNEQEQRGREAAQIISTRVQDQANSSCERNLLRLTLPPKGVHPLLLEARLDPALPPGSFQTFDITQTEPGGRRGGIRLTTVVVPPGFDL